MDIHVMQTGWTLVSSAVPDRSTYRWGKAYTRLFQSKKSRIKVPVKAFLIENQGHRVLVDTGWSDECVEHGREHLGFSLWYASEPVMRHGEAVPDRLRDLGLEPSDIDAIVLTHMDCDHASGLLPLKGAKRIYASEAELSRAQTHDVRYRSSFWKGANIEPVPYRDDAAAPFGKSCDLFGDGSFQIVFTPGHSAGSQAVLACGKTGYAAFVGDDSYNRGSWEKLKAPGPVYDMGSMRKTLCWVQELSRDPGCIGVYAAHDPEGPQGGTGL